MAAQLALALDTLSHWTCQALVNLHAAVSSSTANMRFLSAAVPTTTTLLGCGLITSTWANHLYVSSYAGTVSTLKLAKGADGAFALTNIATNDGSAPNPSWLTKDSLNQVVYCLDEGLDVLNGSLAAYSTSASGNLTLIDRHTSISGPVSSVVYNGGKGLAAAHYTGSALTTWNILADGGLSPLQNLTFELDGPGTDPSRQDAPHPHEALLDPTGTYVLVPDLGADLVRVFTIDPATSALTAVTPLSVPAGSGPRHGAFLVAGNNTFFFLVSELTSSVASYKLTYGQGELAIEEISSTYVLGPNVTPQDSVFAAEAIVTPDGNYLLTSSRGDNTFQIPNFDPSNKTTIASDSLQVWAINHATGALTFAQNSPAGGSYPRQYSINKAGTLAAVGLQMSARVVVVQRDVQTGHFGKIVANLDVPGQITSIIFDD